MYLDSKSLTYKKKMLHLCFIFIARLPVLRDVTFEIVMANLIQRSKFISPSKINFLKALNNIKQTFVNNVYSNYVADKQIKFNLNNNKFNNDNHSHKHNMDNNAILRYILRKSINI